MADKDILYAIHDFEAENPDEISFRAGERIIVLERDDQYQDGWYHGENSRGERGLFPQTYTQATPLVSAPSSFPVASQQQSQVAHENGFEGDHLNTGGPTENATPELKATIDDVQNHLDDMYRSKDASQVAAVPGVAPPAIVDEVHSTQSTRQGPNAAIQPVDTPADDSASQISKSTRDDASSILDREVDDEGNTTAQQGIAMASHAKENLARNVELAREREAKKKVAEERKREAELEQMRLNAPPIDGLQLSDESDIENSAVIDDEQDDEVPLTAQSLSGAYPGDYPTPRQPQDDFKAAYAQAGPDTDATPQTLASARFAEPVEVIPEEPSPIAQTILPLRSDVTPNESRVISETQALSDSPRAHTPSFSSSIYQPTPSPGPTSGYNFASQEAPPLPESAKTFTSNQAVEPEKSRRDSAKDEGDIIAAYSTHPLAIDTNTLPSLASSQPAQPTNDRGIAPSLDAEKARGHDGIPQEAAQPSEQATDSAARATSSPRESTLASSNRSSTMGSTFTPATSSHFEKSPTSGAFVTRLRKTSDPREWTVDQVVEWGQSKNFDSSIIAKFREHEISGDVLVDMDINMLKEIDIVAFGPRVRIAKAIKELRSFYEPSPLSASSIAPTHVSGTSGVEPDSDSRGASPVQVSAVADSAKRQSFPATPQSPSGQLDVPFTPVRAAPATFPEEGQSTGSATQYTAQTSGIATPPIVPDPDESSVTVDDHRPETLNGSSITDSDGHKGDRHKHKASLGSTMSSAFNRHGRTKSQTPSISGDVPEVEKEKPTKPVARGFLGGTINRGRKPPPRYSTGGLDGPERSSSVMDRLFAFGSTSPTSGTAKETPRPVISAPLEAGAPPGTPEQPASPTTRAPQALAASPRAAPNPIVVASPSVPPSAQSAPARAPTPRKSAPAVLSSASGPAQGQSSREKIGEPDYSGWLRKKSDGYNTWKDRYLILKGVHLYVLKGPNEEKIKGWINLVGYRFISDGSVGSSVSEKSRFGFKAVKEGQQSHYFSSHDSTVIRNWMKALMKATIGRDYTAPVTSSANIKTIPLSVAQAMNPPPRPPSPTSVLRAQKANLSAHPNALSASDAAKLMGASLITSPTSGSNRRASASLNTGASTSPGKHRKTSSLLPPIRSSQRKKPMSESMSKSSTMTSIARANDDERAPSLSPSYIPAVAESDLQPQPASQPPTAAALPASQSALFDSQQYAASNSQEVLNWINDHLPGGIPKAVDWSYLCSGKIYTRVVENLSGKDSGIRDSEFDKFKPIVPGKLQLDYIDTLFKCFDFLVDCQIDTNDVSINDLMTNNQPHMIKLAESIRERYD